MANQYQPPYHDQQQFTDPYGQDFREGTIEEHIHKTATKRMNHSRTPGREIFTAPGVSGKAGMIFGIIGMVLAAAALAFTFMSRSSTDSELTQLHTALTTMQVQVNQDDTKLSGQVSRLGNTVGTLSGMAAFNQACQQYFTGTDGQPHTYVVPCAEKQ